MAKKIKIGWFQKFTVGAELLLKLAAAGADGKITKDEVLSIVSDVLDRVGIDVVGRV